MKILFLDDNENRHAKFRQQSIGCSIDHVYTAAEAIEKIDDEDITYDIIFLDHDLNWQTENQLNEDEEDGRTVARHLATVDRYKDSIVIIHSLNNQGGMLMKGILEDGGYENAFYYPFAWQYFQKDSQGNWVVKQD